MTKEEAGEFLLACIAYWEEEDIEISRFSKLAFANIKAQFDRDFESYKSVCIRNAENWKTWWRPKTQNNPKNPSGYKKTQNNPKNPHTDTDTDNHTDTINNYKELANQNSLEVYPVFLYYFLDLWWKPWSTDTVESLREWMRSTLKNGWINSASDAIQVLREFHAYWDTQRDEKGFKKKNWKKTLLNSPSLPNNKRKYESK